MQKRGDNRGSTWFFPQPFFGLSSFFLFPLSVFFSPAQERARGKSNLVRASGLWKFSYWSLFGRETNPTQQVAEIQKKKIAAFLGLAKGSSQSRGRVRSFRGPSLTGSDVSKSTSSFSCLTSNSWANLFPPLAVTDSSRNLGVAGRFFSPLEEFQRQEAT